EGNARIEPAIEDVGDEVEEHHEASEHERHSHHDGCIVGEDRADEQRADPGNTKDLFGDDGASEDGRHLQSHQRYDGDQCIAHDVFHDDYAFAETFRARRRDVVEADDVQHGGAHIAHKGGGLKETEDGNRHERLLDVLPVPIKSGRVDVGTIHEGQPVEI